MEDLRFSNQLNFKKIPEMETKKLLVSFLSVVFILALVATVSADNLANSISVEINDIPQGDVHTDGRISVVAGEMLVVEVTFRASNDDTSVTLEAKLEGDKVDVEAISAPFDIEAGKRYKKTLTLRVPYELQDERSDLLTLELELDGEDHKTELEDIGLRVQRPSYNADVKSVVVPQFIDAGDTVPVDVVIKNLGYNELEDLYVTVSIPALGLTQTDYFGDLIELECDDEDAELELDCNDDDDEDTRKVRLYLEVPYEVAAGVYELNVEVVNDDTVTSESRSVTISNDVTNTVIVSSTSKNAAVGEDAEYSILLVNPTDNVKVYRVITESASGLSTSASESVVAVPAGSSKTVTISASADEEGEYEFGVNILSGEALVSTVVLELDVEGSSVTDPVVVLTVILAIIFIVLLIVLIVLIGKKPEKSEEFGESYY